ncbi:MAG: hypothetical protein AAGD38_04035 [Acidobacteriota bacterium]
MTRRLNHRLYYFTVEDESVLDEIRRIDGDLFSIAYKVTGTDDVFVATADTKEAMDRHDIPYNLLAEEDGTRIGLCHTPQSREELADYEEAVKALTLAYRAIGAACVGVNGDNTIDLSDGAKHYSYFTAPAGHTFLWRLFTNRDEAASYIAQIRPGDHESFEWAESLPLETADELVGYH